MNYGDRITVNYGDSGITVTVHIYPNYGDSAYILHANVLNILFLLLKILNPGQIFEMRITYKQRGVV